MKTQLYISFTTHSGSIFSLIQMLQILIQMQINKNRQLITLQQTLAYIKYLNREQPFGKEQVVVPLKDYEELTQQQHQRIVTPKDKSRKLKFDAPEDEDQSKKINKNRAIKRIIESAFHILQGFKTYQEAGEENSGGDKSANIQFNIYLKQYNRVLEMIHSKEKERLSRRALTTERHQELLQGIYEYTVVEDFREVLPVAILKDKISKNNVEIMIKALSDCLVVLRSNELRVHESGGVRSIRMHQIENVDYHTQPYIFIVLTIQKDKDRFNIYMRFDSQKNQEKWDRALYCCYIGRKMKTKEKFFLLQYPEEDVKKKEDEETKKLAAFNYDPDPLQPLNRIFAEGRTKSTSSRKELEDDLASRSNKTINRNMSASKTILNKNTSSKEEQEEPFPLIDRTASELGIKGTTLRSNNQLTVIDSDTHRGGPTDRLGLDNSLINRNKTDFIQINKSQQLIPPEPDYTERNNMGSFSQIEEENKVKPEEYIEQLQHDVLPQDIRRIHDIQRKNVKGIPLQKEKFFFNKQKMAFLKENHQKQSKEDVDVQSEYEAMKQRELEYWDFDPKSGQKTERKVIRIPNVTKYAIREDGALSITHENNKEIVFLGQPTALKEILQWVTLIQTIYKTKLVPRTPKILQPQQAPS